VALIASHLSVALSDLDVEFLPRWRRSVWVRRKIRMRIYRPCDGKTGTTLGFSGHISPNLLTNIQ